MPPRNYPNHYDTYALTSRYRPITIELDRDGIMLYRELANNPIYWKEAIQYTGGSLYRAALGYELLWDRKAEEKLISNLDYQLTRHENNGHYFIEEMKVMRDHTCYGIPWIRGVKHEQRAWFAKQWPFKLREGENLTIRVNLLDAPYHVDIEQADGQVHTMRYMAYRFLLKHIFKRKRMPSNEKSTNKPRPGTNPKATAYSGKPGLSLVKPNGRRKPFERSAVKLSFMQQTKRWPNSL